jgi:hypothetical protein
LCTYVMQFLHPSVTSSLFGPNILVSPCSHTPLMSVSPDTHSSCSAVLTVLTCQLECNCCHTSEQECGKAQLSPSCAVCLTSCHTGESSQNPGSVGSGRDQQLSAHTETWSLCHRQRPGGPHSAVTRNVPARTSRHLHRYGNCRFHPTHRQMNHGSHRRSSL